MCVCGGGGKGWGEGVRVRGNSPHRAVYLICEQQIRSAKVEPLERSIGTLCVCWWEGRGGGGGGGGRVGGTVRIGVLSHL